MRRDRVCIYTGPTGGGGVVREGPRKHQTKVQLVDFWTHSHPEGSCLPVLINLLLLFSLHFCPCVFPGLSVLWNEFGGLLGNHQWPRYHFNMSLQEITAGVNFERTKQKLHLEKYITETLDNSVISFQIFLD